MIMALTALFLWSPATMSVASLVPVSYVEAWYECGVHYGSLVHVNALEDVTHFHELGADLPVHVAVSPKRCVEPSTYQVRPKHFVTASPYGPLVLVHHLESRHNR